MLAVGSGHSSLPPVCHVLVEFKQFSRGPVGKCSKMIKRMHLYFTHVLITMFTVYNLHNSLLECSCNTCGPIRAIDRALGPPSSGLSAQPLRAADRPQVSLHGNPRGACGWRRRCWRGFNWSYTHPTQSLRAQLCSLEGSLGTRVLDTRGRGWGAPEEVLGSARLPAPRCPVEDTVPVMLRVLWDCPEPGLRSEDWVLCPGLSGEGQQAPVRAASAGCPGLVPAATVLPSPARPAGVAAAGAGMRWESRQTGPPLALP